MNQNRPGAAMDTKSGHDTKHVALSSFALAHKIQWVIIEMKAEMIPLGRPTRSPPCVRRNAAGVTTRAAVEMEAQEGGSYPESYSASRSQTLA